MRSTASHPGLSCWWRRTGGTDRLLALASRPQWLRGLVIGNTSVSPPAPTFKPTPFHRLSQCPGVSTALFKGLGFPLGLLHLAQGERGSIRGDVARAYRWPLARRVDCDAPLALARMVPDHPERHPSIPQLRECEAYFRSIDVPIQIVWGTRDPILGRVVNHLGRLRPDAKVVRTEAGHFLQEEVPEPLADAVGDVAATCRW
jgi:pimeloyl-ACP methyl ester carboxylesterase